MFSYAIACCHCYSVRTRCERLKRICDIGIDPPSIRSSHSVLLQASLFCFDVHDPLSFASSTVLSSDCVCHRSHIVYRISIYLLFQYHSFALFFPITSHICLFLAFLCVVFCKRVSVARIVRFFFKFQVNFVNINRVQTIQMIFCVELKND